MALDPNFLTNYKHVVRSAAAFLKSRRDQIVAAITPLFPNWIGKGLFFAACPLNQDTPVRGITSPIAPCIRRMHEGFIPSRATIEYGAVENIPERAPWSRITRSISSSRSVTPTFSINCKLRV